MIDNSSKKLDIKLKILKFNSQLYQNNLRKLANAGCPSDRKEFSIYLSKDYYFMDNSVEKLDITYEPE